MKRQVIALIVIFSSTLALAGIKLPMVISDHMVLQAGKPVPIWGTADANAEVVVTFAGQTQSTHADGNGKWTLTLGALAVSNQPRSLTIRSGPETKQLDDILVGEVWICGGQSNMEKPMVPQRGQVNIPNMEQEIQSADFPEIRFVVIPRPPNKPSTSAATNPATAPATRPAPLGWLVCTPDNVRASRVSAVGYYFGREIHRKAKVPVGLIHSNIGGTRIEPWTPVEGFDLVPSLKPFADAVRAGKRTKVEDSIPASLYETMITPIVPYGIRGAIWYQGESNHMVHDGLRYTDKMRALVGGWRAVFGQGDFPFYFVQIAPHLYSVRKVDPPIKPDDLSTFWEAQTKAMLEIPHTGMAVITDLVDNVKDIHPPRKMEVGQRLSLWALKNEYGMSDIDPCSPMATDIVLQGKEVIVTFDHSPGGLVCPGDVPTHFELAGEDGKFVPAKAQIDASKVKLTADSVDKPMAVRFAGYENSTPNLFNKAGLPVNPFSAKVK